MTKTLEERIADLERDILRSNKGELDGEEVSGTFEIATEIITELQVSLKHFKTTSDDFRDNMLAYKEESESIGEIVNRANLILVDQIRNLQAKNQALLATNGELEGKLKEIAGEFIANGNNIDDSATLSAIEFHVKSTLKTLGDSALSMAWKEKHLNDPQPYDDY